jgi:hypothetical protein
MYCLYVSRLPGLSFPLPPFVFTSAGWPAFLPGFLAAPFFGGAACGFCKRQHPNRAAYCTSSCCQLPFPNIACLYSKSAAGAPNSTFAHEHECMHACTHPPGDPRLLLSLGQAEPPQPPPPPLQSPCPPAPHHPPLPRKALVPHGPCQRGPGLGGSPQQCGRAGGRGHPRPPPPQHQGAPRAGWQTTVSEGEGVPADRWQEAFKSRRGEGGDSGAKPSAPPPSRGTFPCTFPSTDVAAPGPLAPLQSRP